MEEDLCGTKNVTNIGWCPEINDTILCWPETPPGTLANKTCPNYLEGEAVVGFAYKLCRENGTWYVNEKNITWTNYEDCRFPDEILEFYKCINFLYIIGYAISSLALLVSLVVFFSFRILKCTRIKIHIQLFISFLINSLLSIIWYTEVVTKVEVTEANPLWCQFLHIAKEYFMVANYMWMFCESLHLHIALVVVFMADEKIMKWFYAIGWGGSFLIVLTHNLVRIYLSQDTERCFMEENRVSTWFISVPIVLTLASSIIFLINILLVILTTRNPASPNPAPDSTRKAVRAALILTPLFGLQFIFIPVKPDVGHPLYNIYLYFSMVIISYQGLCCSILFCFANHEVHQAVKRSIQRNAHFQYTRSTNYQTADSGGTGFNLNGQNSMPLLSTHKHATNNGSVKL
ncbi:calcitonin gene-related peptide type 1 receptor-like [Anthonomus grandis grandis]|uniref:calcitonin gene-related peptide type 1 receptor-like n=1 Tax=Anthonomus grandis grandis TaxID=2921223 RepID=UPI0021659948|nr:calcitonin gene-related peptide type 1 receptor-like [Anthonomus grandis grandis]